MEKSYVCYTHQLTNLLTYSPQDDCLDKNAGVNQLNVNERYFEVFLKYTHLHDKFWSLRHVGGCPNLTDKRQRKHPLATMCKSNTIDHKIITVR